jgi:hypothetical protein
MAKVKREETWLNSTTPSSLLRTLKGKRLPRQRRLFAVACCRRVMEAIPDLQSRQAVDIAERFADGLASVDELQAAYQRAQRIAQQYLESCRDAGVAAWSLWRLLHAAQLTCAPSGMDEASREILKRASRVSIAFRQQETKAHADLIRDLFGNPFRPPPIVAPEWRAWQSGTVLQLAKAIYDERSFERLPILADALEEAGCDRPELLEHFRSTCPHARGCWALDLLL